jgi:hypothetical protein
MCHQTLFYHLPLLTPPSYSPILAAEFSGLVPSPFLDAFDSTHHSSASVFISSCTLQPRGRFLTSVVFAFNSAHSGLSNLPLCRFSYPHQCIVYSLDKGISKPSSGKSTTSTPSPCSPLLRKKTLSLPSGPRPRSTPVTPPQ